MQTHRPLPRLCFGEGAASGSRELPEEVAIALSFNGSTQAVMMATPADLIDFAYGFSLSEGIAAPDEIEGVEPVETPLGIDLQIWLTPAAEARLGKRRRSMAGPVGCGLCGIDSLEEVLRQPRKLPSSSYQITPAEIMRAVAALPAKQKLHDLTRAVHAAGYWTGELVALREDVGRHNALDKLSGHLIRDPLPPGAVVLTSRISIDMVQKTAALGCPVLIAVSAPTAQAVTLAEAAGITLIALARPQRFEVYSHPHRVTEETADVA
jgi:FdhD protein